MGDFVPAVKLGKGTGMKPLLTVRTKSRTGSTRLDLLSGYMQNGYEARYPYTTRVSLVSTILESASSMSVNPMINLLQSHYIANASSQTQLSSSLNSSTP